MTLSANHFHFTWLSVPEEYVYWVGKWAVSAGHGCGGELTAVCQCQWKMSLLGQKVGTVSAQGFILKRLSACFLSPLIEPNSPLSCFLFGVTYNQF